MEAEDWSNRGWRDRHPEFSDFREPKSPEWEDEDYFFDYDGPKPKPDWRQGLKLVTAVVVFGLLVLISGIVIDW